MESLELRLEKAEQLGKQFKKDADDNHFLKEKFERATGELNFLTEKYSSIFLYLDSLRPLYEEAKAK